MREQEFRDAINAHPSDRNLQLVFADWLDEQGSPEADFWRDACNFSNCETIISDAYFECGNGEGHGYGDLKGNGSGIGEPPWDEMSGCGYGNVEGDGDAGGCHSGNGYSDFHEYIFTRDGLYIKSEFLMEGPFILVCDRGFVLVGKVSPNPSDWQRVLVDHCATVRIWGTSEGLGQLAREGPLEETVLDREGNGVDILRASIMRAIPCNESAWADYFAEVS